MGGEPGSGSRGRGADAFDDLLAGIATLTEMQRVALVGFLRKEAVCDIFAVARFTVFEARDASGIGVRLFDSKLRDERRLFAGRGEDEESGRSGGTETSDKPRAPRYEGVVRLGNRRADAGERIQKEYIAAGGCTQCFVTVHLVGIHGKRGEFNTETRLPLPHTAPKFASDSSRTRSAE